jgi:hypothetical protein
LVSIAVLGSACTSEQSSPIDLDSTTTTDATLPESPPVPDDDPNAQAREQVIELAKEQCRLHPEREFGVIVIADADGEEVNRYEYPCADLEPVGSE